MIGLHPKVYQTRSSNAKEKVRSVVWTCEMDNCLTKVLAEQVKKGNKVDNILKPAAFAAALKAMNDKFGMCLTKEHIKNRLKTLRKQFRILKEILIQRGFVWNETQKMVVADNSVWNEYIKAHPDARTFRAKCIENYDELCIIIGNDQAVASFSDNVTKIDVNFAVDKGDQDLTIVSEIQTDGNQSKILRWTEEMDCCLGKILVDQVRKGLKVDKVLQTEAYEITVSALNAKFGLQVTKYNIKNRLETWKKQYELLREILSHAGFKWDETRKMVTADDSTWNDYGRKHPEARHLQARRIENYHELGIIFGDEQVSGNLSKIDVNLAPNYEVNPATPALIFSNEEMRRYDASDEAQNSSEQTRPRPLSSLSKQPSKRRHTSDVMIEMMSVMAADICRIANVLTESNNKTAWLEEVVEKVQNIPDFDDDLIIEACEYLCFNEKRALMFLKLDERLRIKWLLKRLRC